MRISLVNRVPDAYFTIRNIAAIFPLIDDYVMVTY